MRKKKIFRIFGFLFSLIICVNSFDITVFAEDNNQDTLIEQTDSENTSTESIEEIDLEKKESDWDGITMNSLYETDEYKVTFSILDYWEGEYNASIAIENIGKERIENWCLEFPFSQNIIDIWNGKIIQNENGCYLIKNIDWNQDIPVGETRSFGFTVSGSPGEFPEQYNIINDKEIIKTDKYEIVYEVDNDTTTGFIGKIKITNISDTIIEDWFLDCDFENEISNIWNGKILSHEGNHYTIGNVEYNQNIYPNTSIEIGFNVSNGTVKNMPKNMELGNISTDKALDIITISEKGLILDIDSFSLTNEFLGFSGTLDKVNEVNGFSMFVYDKNQTLIYQEDIEIKEEWTVKNIGLIYGYNRVVFNAAIGNQVDTKEIIINCNTNCYFENLDVDMEDSDKDGLFNYLEDYFGTNRDLIDTDNDGLTDMQELYYFGYDPLNSDTDNDGISDYYEDEDDDTLSNGQELSMNMNPLDNDSDNDQLLDNLEIEFGTSPIIEDTDEDGITDYEEYQLSKIEYEYNEKTDSYVATFSADKMNISYDEAVIPSVKLTADAKGILSFRIEKVESSYVLNPSMAGYLGAAYDFSTNGTMKSAELTFTYNEEFIEPDILNSEDFCPTIYYYNSEDDTFEEVEGQRWSGNEVTVTLSHFSTYILVNKADMDKLWNRSLEIEDDVDYSNFNQVVFVLDKSGSMQSNDPYFIRTSLIREFFDRIDANDQVGLVGFSNNAVNYTAGLTNDEEELDKALEAFENQKDYGGTYMNNALISAVTMLNSVDNSNNAKKSIFILTDGITSDKLSDSYLDTIKKQGITIYTVGLGNVSKTYLENIAHRTGGEYYYARTSSDLSEIFIDFEDEIKLYDLNRDGLNDELTKLICKGEITTITGTTIFCEEAYDLIMESDDFDGDGLKNGEEITIYYYSGIPYFRINSLPEIIDSDFDGYSDYEEVKELYTQPLVPNYVVDSSDFIYVDSYMNFESGKAYDDYIEDNIGVNLTERFLDVVLCGGEINLNKKIRRELLDYFAQYASENEEELTCSSVVNVTNNYLRGIVDLLPGLTGIGIARNRMQLTQQVNDIQKQIRMFYGVPYSKSYKKALLNKIELLNKEFANSSSVIKSNSSKLAKYGTYAGFALTVFACTAQNIEEATEYYAAIEVLRNYEDILIGLGCCGNSNVETAAQYVMKDMSDIHNKYATGLTDSLSNIFSYGLAAGGSYYITSSLGIPGLVIDLVWLASSVIVGSAFSTRLQNSIAVDFSIGMGLATNSNMSEGIYKADASGDVNLIFSDNIKNKAIQRFWLADIYSKQWCESKYLNYLNDDSFFMDEDFFLYKAPDSATNAKDNIDKLSGLYNIYYIR